MKKRLLLLVVLLFCMFTLTSCLTVDHIMVEVGQGLKNVTDHESYCIETEIYLNNPEETRDEFAEPNAKFILTVDGNKNKYEITLGSVSYTYYVVYDEEGYGTLIFNANPFMIDDTLWLSQQTVIEAPNNEQLLDIDSEYFDLEEDVYTLNEAGQQNIMDWLSDIYPFEEYVDINLNEQSVTKVFVDCDYVRQIKSNLVILDFVEEGQLYEADLEISFTRFDEAVVTLPRDYVSVDEFVTSIQEACEEFISDVRESIVETLEGLGEEFLDELLNMELEALEQVKDIVAEIVGEYEGAYDLIEDLLDYVAEYVEIDGLFMEILEHVLSEYDGIFDGYEDIFDAIEDELIDDVELLYDLFVEFVTEYEEEIYSFIVDKIMELLGL